MLGVGEFGEETEWSILNGTVYCVILRFVYVGIWTVWGGDLGGQK